MTRIAVPYTMTVYCEVDTETGQVERVVTASEDMTLDADDTCYQIDERGIYHSMREEVEVADGPLAWSDGKVVWSPYASAEDEAAAKRAIEIAQSDQDWPAWENSY